MIGLFAWAGTESVEAAQGLTSPVVIAQAFVADVNAHDCQALIGLVGSSALHPRQPSCAEFPSTGLSLKNCTYVMGTPPPASYTSRLTGYSDVNTVDTQCQAVVHGLTVPFHFVFVTAVSSSDGSLRIVDARTAAG